jgi:hypothetical protein
LLGLLVDAEDTCDRLLRNVGLFLYYTVLQLRRLTVTAVRNSSLESKGNQGNEIDRRNEEKQGGTKCHLVREELKIKTEQKIERNKLT